MLESTIVAQATPIGKSGVSIVRMSGKKSLDIAKQIFYCKNFTIPPIPNHMYLGKIDIGGVCDKGFLIYFKSPHSFTGEDIIEFQCHGGSLVSQKIINKCLELGAVIPSAGEFSKRAFLNGKMSLDQAEGVIDTINAETENQLKASNQLTKGNLQKKVQTQQDILTDILSEIEVNLDYPEHDIEYETKNSIKRRLVGILDQLDGLLSTKHTGKLIKNGISVAIVGKTNVGKSSLLNALLNYEQAIVTDIEGTTRDIVTGCIEYKGFNFCFYDTAGIRQTQDKIEQIGITKSKQTLENCDIVLLVLDATKILTEQDKENLELIKNKKALIVLNKCDIENKFDNSLKVFKVSAKENTNIEELKEEIYKLSLENCSTTNQLILTNTRHIQALEEARQILIEIDKNIDTLPLDCVALDVRNVYEKLGEITGQTANEEIINKIFSKFCLGK